MGRNFAFSFKRSSHILEIKKRSTIDNVRRILLLRKNKSTGTIRDLKSQKIPTSSKIHHSKLLIQIFFGGAGIASSPVIIVSSIHNSKRTNKTSRLLERVDITTLSETKAKKNHITKLGGPCSWSLLKAIQCFVKLVNVARCMRKPWRHNLLLQNDRHGNKGILDIHSRRNPPMKQQQGVVRQ